MVRDNLRGQEYFDKYLIYENENIEKFEIAIEKVVKERGADDEGVRSAYNYLCGLHFSKLKILYSSGASLMEVKKFFPKVIDIMRRVWKAESGYVEMLCMISIGIMLDISDEEKTRLEELVRIDQLDDGLINFLISSYNKEWAFHSPKVKFDRPYAFLIELIKSDDNEYSLILLKEYLVEKWYRGHNDMGWHDTHKIEDDSIYSGYWSFESGAIAKILQLEDRSLKDTPYYPYDMVHYQ